MDPCIGLITMFAGDFAPKSWAFCNGQLLAINQNQALFSILGTTYGGNGTTTFALPDLRGRTPVHSGQGPGLNNFILGQVSGSENITLNITNLPAHSHQGTITLGASSSAATHDKPEGRVPSSGSVNAFQKGATATGQLGGVSAIVQPAGANPPVAIRQPYLGINFIICLYGIYPSRN